MDLIKKFHGTIYPLIVLQNCQNVINMCTHEIFYSTIEKGV